MDCLNKETIPQYFELLKDMLSEHKLLNSPAQIYNVDETGMPLNHRAPRVVTKRGQKKVRCCTSGNKSQITVMTGARVIASVQSFFRNKRKRRNRRRRKEQKEAAAKKKAEERKAKEEAAKKKADEKARKAAEKAIERETRSNKRQKNTVFVLYLRNIRIP